MWGGLGNAANVAQLTGIDAAGLIAAIRRAALTARQNKKECEHLALRVGLLADVLPRLQEQEKHNPLATRSLAGLGDTLREAYQLVMFCQAKGRTYHFFNGRRLAERFRDVERKIDIYLSFFPLLSHTAIARRLDDDDSTTSTRSSSSSSQRSRDDDCCGGEEFTLAEVVAATGGFAADVLSASDSATVYRGTLRDGREVAVKRLLINTAAGPGRAAAEDAFFTEVAILSPIRHRHIVRLVGRCADGDERIVVTHPYTGNGSLYDHLHGRRTSPVTASWEARVQVLLGAARAVEHLHCHAVPLVIHANVTSSAVLLEDATWAPRLSGFGGAVWRAAGVESQAVDLAAAAGYADPEHRSTGRLRPASDVYSLGVVILEVLTGKPPVVRVWDEGSCAMVAMDLVSFALPSIQHQQAGGGRLLDVLDRRPASDPTAWQLQPLQMLANTAACCLRLHGDNRPPIPDVVADLEQALHLICTRGHLS